MPLMSMPTAFVKSLMKYCLESIRVIGICRRFRARLLRDKHR